jgi:hypothetical protein
MFSVHVILISMADHGCRVTAPLLPDIDRRFSPKECIGVDFAEAVVSALKLTSTTVEYKKMDARALDFQDEIFDFVVEKGTVE